VPEAKAGKQLFSRWLSKAYQDSPFKLPAMSGAITRHCPLAMNFIDFGASSPCLIVRLSRPHGMPPQMSIKILTPIA
jgi:hypothetical protein